MKRRAAKNCRKKDMHEELHAARNSEIASTDDYMRAARSAMSTHTRKSPKWLWPICGQLVFLQTIFFDFLKFADKRPTFSFLKERLFLLKDTLFFFCCRHWVDFFVLEFLRILSWQVGRPFFFADFAYMCGNEQRVASIDQQEARNQQRAATKSSNR